MSKNDTTIDHIFIACRQFEELRAAGCSENKAIRQVEYFVELYAKRYMGGRRNRHRPDDVGLWSIAARKLRETNPKAGLRVEHGTPRRALAKMVLELYRKGELNEEAVNGLAKRYWKLAVITLDEDKGLNAVGARSKMFASPEERWLAAGIKFEET